MIRFKANSGECLDGEITQRKFTVFIGHSAAWVNIPLKGIPRLYFSESYALLCDGWFAFRIGGLLRSEYQAKLWCEYHGFDFSIGLFEPLPPGFFQRKEPRFSFKLRPRELLRFEDYEYHRQRCPDCQRRERKRL